MTKILDTMSRLITARPYITLIALFVVTVLLGYGATLRAPPTEGADVAFLPPGHPIANVTQEIDELFGDSGEVRVVTLVFRGEALTPDGLSQMDSLVNSVTADPAVSGLLAPTNPVAAPSLLAKALLQVDSFESVTPEQIEAAPSPPEIKAALAAMTGTDVDGAPVAIAVIRLRDTGDEQIADAERRINELATGQDGSLGVSSLSPVVIEDEYKQATESGLGPLLGLALLLIAGLLLLFTRAISDMLLTLLGLIFAIVWVVGAEGWLGPNALGLIGPPSSLTTMVPVIIISLTVDYAIQAISHYREQRVLGESVLRAVRVGFREVSIPVTLAAVTTIVSLLAGLFSPIGVIGDFGVVAGLGVGMSLIVMLTLIPAGRTVIDRRRESRGTLRPARPIANALPGIPRVAELLGRWVTRWPAPCLVAVLLITIGLGYAATGLKSEFSIRDILPRGGSVIADMNTLDAAVGGSTEMASVLVKAEVTETRTLLNLRDLTAAFQDEERRPGAASGPILASYDLLVHDWTNDSGRPGDKYDPELAALLREASAGVELDPALMQELVDRIEAEDPEAARLLVNDPSGLDTMLIQFPAYSGDAALAKEIQGDIEALWFGDDEDITATSESIIAVTVTDAITDRQTEAISATVAIALGILSIFFWMTLRQPAFGLIAVGPIVLVLIWVLGTMALLGIPYSLITSIITALSIGIGVDYTIHVIHRYREEYTRTRNPEQAAIQTLTTTGSALLGSALTTAFGFGVLIASPLLASQQFGITATITIVYSLVVSVLVVLPAMVVWGAYQNVRLRSMVERMWSELDVAIDDIQRRDERQG
ncbi:MAG: MMPL family transporter [Chloroflexota bacterium]|nr:MMPL family transporter [Chloroflexota bacterium]MDE2683306.1 MMPL family transporter [Chloroflexota bacterium]